MKERRKELRGPAFMGGCASFGNGLTTASVLIRNASVSGAKLVIDGGHFVPDQFDLTVPQWGAEVRATARWRRNEQIGIEFARVDRSDAAAPLAVERLVSQLKAKNRKLKRRIAELTQ